MQSIGLDIASVQDKFVGGDKTGQSGSIIKYDTFALKHVENIMSMIINLLFKNTDEKIRNNFKKWTTKFSIPENLQKFMQKLFKAKAELFTSTCVLMTRVLIVLSKCDVLETESSQKVFKATFPLVLNLFNDAGKEAGLMDEAIKYIAQAFNGNKDRLEFLVGLLNQIVLNSDGFLKTLHEIITKDYDNQVR